MQVQLRVRVQARRRKRIAERMVPPTGPDAWAIDDAPLPNGGKMSVAVTHQHCGAPGKQANYQVAGGERPSGHRYRLLPTEVTARRSP
ncbi:hypothetical protein GCM10009864_34690 [Streptomyces lunalinharesii]|uniref:Transposase IS701-like DDE domain-containing protein n=1 Tax=Streptomyces lunalinharesii TaxID=333384 RepID=A0ABN3RY02_9ACTN